jgi:hypothetical protein
VVVEANYVALEPVNLLECLLDTRHWVHRLMFMDVTDRRNGATDVRRNGATNFNFNMVQMHHIARAASVA